MSSSWADSNEGVPASYVVPSHFQSTLSSQEDKFHKLLTIRKTKSRNWTVSGQTESKMLSNFTSSFFSSAADGLTKRENAKAVLSL